MQTARYRWAGLVILNVLAWCVLSLYQAGMAQSPRGPQLPFANSNEQRSELVREVQEIKELLKETNALLREGLRSDENPANKRR